MSHILALGLMSGTSADGIDAALVRTDGQETVAVCGGFSWAYPDAFRQQLLAACRTQMADAALVRDLTLRHADAVRQLVAATGMQPDLIGFHGHTILHAPERGITRQIGDGALLAAVCGVDVVCDFRRADVAAGGQGAPLVPVYHRAVTGHLPAPRAIVNIGGVANVTWIGADGTMLACDTGPGNALLDDWVMSRTGQAFDVDGALAQAGQVDAGLLERWLQHPYFAALPPKSLDRNRFYQDLPPLAKTMTVADGAATLTAFTAHSIAAVRRFFPQPVQQWVVVGGGARNGALMAALAASVPEPVMRGEDAGLDSNLLEAEAFAYLAVRSRRGLPLSFPGTTGVGRATGGGVYCPASGVRGASQIS